MTSSLLRSSGATEYQKLYFTHVRKDSKYATCGDVLTSRMVRRNRRSPRGRGAYKWGVIVESRSSGVSEAIKWGEISSVSLGSGLGHVASLYKVSQDSGLEAPEIGDEVKLLSVDIHKQEGELEHVSLCEIPAVRLYRPVINPSNAELNFCFCFL